MLDKIAAEYFLNKTVRLDTDSTSYNHFVGTVLKVTERALILQFIDGSGRTIVFDLQDIVMIKEGE
jgi:hypothetical protein